MNRKQAKQTIFLIPQVTYRFPGEPYRQWIDVYDRLYQERIIVLRQELDDKIANQIITQMLHLDVEEPSKDIRFQINSSGGSVTAGMAIHDTMQCLNSDVVTICMGLAASM